VLFAANSQIGGLCCFSGVVWSAAIRSKTTHCCPPEITVGAATRIWVLALSDSSHVPEAVDRAELNERRRPH